MTAPDHLGHARELARNGGVFHVLLSDLPEAVYRWKPAPKRWSLLEVVCHLCDEEREDFRARTRLALESPGALMPPIDPQGWVDSRRYAQQDYESRLQDFLDERRASVAWLESLQSPDWGSACAHPRFGPMTAGMFLVNWIAHDYLHLRQILRIKHEYLAKHGGEDLRYAGTW